MFSEEGGNMVSHRTGRNWGRRHGCHSHLRLAVGKERNALKRETFTDPETGREIESTWLARVVSQNLPETIAGVVIFIIVVVLVLSTFLPLGILIFGLLLTIFNPLVAELLMCLVEDHGQEWEKNIHDAVARWQDRRREVRRQRRIWRRRYPHIPDGALSRAQPPGEPGPTAASLSRADVPEENLSRLAASVEDYHLVDDEVRETVVSASA